MPNRPIIVRALTSVEGLALHVDGWPDRSHKITSRTGSERLEDGLEVTDHVVADSPSVVLTGIVSDFAGARRAAESWQAIRALHRKEEPVRIVTEWETLDEVVIKRAEARPSGRGMRFEMEVAAIVRVGAGAAVPAVAQTGSASRRSGEVERGRQPLIAAQFQGSGSTVSVGTALAVARGEIPASTLIST